MQRDVFHLKLHCLHTSTRQFSCSDDDITEAIGFTAYAAEDRFYSFYETVLFDAIVSNRGGYYNPLTSSFICPLNGIYMFFITLNTDYSSVRATITRNSDDLTMTWARTTVPGEFNHGSNMAVTECNIGDVIWSRVEFTGYDRIVYTGDKPVTTFSGVLVRTF